MIRTPPGRAGGMSPRLQLESERGSRVARVYYSVGSEPGFEPWSVPLKPVLFQMYCMTLISCVIQNLFRNYPDIIESRW